MIKHFIPAYKANHLKEEIFMKTAQFTKSLTVSMRPEVFDQIKQITDKKQISIGEWIRNAIDAALANNNREEDSM
jgi:hypothetical protein